MATIETHTFVTNFNADGQETAGVELMTDERGHMYPISKLFSGNTLGNALKVIPPSGTARKVNITAGYVQIPYEDYAFLGWLEDWNNTGSTELDLDAPSTTYPRYSAIVAYIDQDIQYEESVSNNPGLLKITEVKGEAASTPVEVDDAKIRNDQKVGNNPYVLLAQVYIPANASSISQANIIDRRTSISLREGVQLPYGSYATGVNPAAGSSYSNPLQIAVINANDTVPSASSTNDILVCRINQ